MRLDSLSPVQKRLFLAAVVLLVLLAAYQLAGSHGLVRYLQLRGQLAKITAENQELAAGNQLLAEENRRLRDDPKAFEDFARRQYSLVRDNEILFDFAKKP